MSLGWHGPSARGGELTADRLDAGPATVAWHLEREGLTVPSTSVYTSRRHRWSASPSRTRGALFIARVHAQPVGCGAIKFHPGAPAELKRTCVAPEARGRGIGRRILGELERLAGAGGAHVVRLETNRALSEAIALYRGRGFREVAAFNDERYPDHWFEKQLSVPDRGRKTRRSP